MERSNITWLIHKIKEIFVTGLRVKNKTVGYMMRTFWNLSPTLFFRSMLPSTWPLTTTKPPKIFRKSINLCISLIRQLKWNLNSNTVKTRKKLKFIIIRDLRWEKREIITEPSNNTPRQSKQCLVILKHILTADLLTISSDFTMKQ